MRSETEQAAAQEVRQAAAAAGKRRWAKTLAALAISLLVGLALAEGLVRVAERLGWLSPAPGMAELSAGGVDEDQVRLAVRPDDGARPLHVADAQLHHRMAAHWSGFFPEEIMAEVGRSQVPIRTNSQGLRSPELAQPKPEGVVRLVALGDSVTFGWGMRSEDTYPSQLASLLATLHPHQRFEVVNAGVSGYGTWQELGWLEEAGLALEPDVVLVQAHLNDAADNWWAWADGQDGGQGWLVRHSRLARLAQQVLAGASWRSAGSCAAGGLMGSERVCWERTEQLLSDLRATAAAAGAVTVLMPSPMRWQVEPAVRDGRSWVDEVLYQEPLRLYAQRAGWIFVDPLPAFRAASSGGQALFLDVAHPNEAGQRLLAQALYDALSQAGMVP